MYSENPFIADEMRKAMAQNSRYDELLLSYDGRFNDLPDISTAKLWDFKAKVMLKTFKEKRDRFAHVLNLLDSDGLILDWGIGSGEIYEALDSSRRKNYVGIDVSGDLVKNMTALHPEGVFRQQTLKEVETSGFSQLCALEVLEHIQAGQLPKVLLEINRILCEGGNLICSVPLYEELRFMTISCPCCGSLANKEGHCRSYTPELIAAELLLAGFEITEKRYVWTSYDHPLLKIREWLKRLAGFAKPANIVIKARKTTGRPKFSIYTE
ncbi:MAG: class I SAM-dependent methyltransferase [Burkholderiales bacterium]